MLPVWAQLGSATFFFLKYVLNGMIQPWSACLSSHMFESESEEELDTAVFTVMSFTMYLNIDTYMHSTVEVGLVWFVYYVTFFTQSSVHI